MSKPDKQGITERDHLETVERQTGIRPKDLDGPEFPDLMSHIWSAFLHLSQGRGSGFSGPNPLSYPEIMTWAEIMGITIGPFELEAIKRLDKVYTGAINE